ncbi:MAG: 8-amino-7-oxononanoate synthase [Planctomycetaceae bacterium]|jgi:8-amino-7-oxononanoate synthase
MSDSLGWIPGVLEELGQSHLLRARRQVVSLPDGWCEIDGRRLRNFSGNDYLGLAQHPRLRDAARRALDASGCGAGASPLVSGRSLWMVELEETLAWFERSDAAVVFPTGYAANLGVIPALVSAGEDDVIFCDRLNHASLVDGCRLAGVRLRVFRHTELERLEQDLRRCAGARRRVIVCDGVFSMDGDLAPLAELVRLARANDALLVVDEAHGTGVWGETGRGVCEHFQVEEEVPVRIGTLSKAVGALGGFLVGRQPLVDYLWNHARTQIYSTALPPPVCAAASEGLRVIDETPALRERLHSRCRLFRQLLAERGLAAADGAEGPIVPLLLADPQLAVELGARLIRRGYLVGTIRPPTVPRGTSRLRISLSAVHDDAALEGLAHALEEAWPETTPRRSSTAEG